MSVAIGVRKGRDIVIAADSQESFGKHRELAPNLRVEKILKVGSAYLAFTGWSIYDSILMDYLAHQKSHDLSDERAIFRFFIKFWHALKSKYSYVNDQPDKEDESPFADLNSSFLVVNQNGIFAIDADMCVSRFDEYFAIGSGCEYASGAAHALYETDADAEAIARAGVKAAIRFNVHCGGEVSVVKLRAR